MLPLDAIAAMAKLLLATFRVNYQGADYLSVTA